MKQQERSYNENSRNRMGNTEVHGGINLLLNGLHYSKMISLITTLRRQKSPGAGMEGAGQKLCKGPPGRPRSPGLDNGLFPDHPPNSFTYIRVLKPISGHTIAELIFSLKANLLDWRERWLNIFKFRLNTEYQIVNTNQNSNFYKHLIFKIMKKQILFLAFFVLALIFAGSKSYGQNVEPAYLDNAPSYCVPAVPLVCGAGDALAPAPGVSYPYEINSSSVGTVHWFVTDDPNVITAQNTLTGTIDAGDGSGAYILTSDAAYNTPANTSLTVNISWKSFDGTANEVLLVAYAIDAAGCTDNIEVYRIRPKYSFTLDIAGLLDDGTSGATECVAPVQTATYDGTNLNVEYGENYVFYTVNAANWQTSWETNLAATTDGASTVGTVEWAYPDEASGAGSVWNASGTAVLASHYASGADGFIDATGECIIVRVPVDHGVLTENITDETINLVVNGEMINPETTAYDGAYPDLDEPASGTDCISDLTTDNADYVITPRPNITDVDPTPFENKVPRD